MKKFAAILLCLCLLFPIFSVSADGAQVEYFPIEKQYFYSDNPELYYYDNPANYYGNISQSTLNELTSAILQAVTTNQIRLSISRFGIKTSAVTMQNFSYIWSHISAEHGEMLDHVEPHIGISLGSYTSLLFDYDITAEEYAQRMEFCENTRKEIIAAIPKNTTDLEKVVFVHDYLVINYSYDTRLFAEDPEISALTNYDMYGLFMEKTGVCQAYACAFNYIMEDLGIESHTVLSIMDIHSWNMVTLNGKTYHIDCSQDDPVYQDANAIYGGGSDFLGALSRKFMLLNDSEIYGIGSHEAWFNALNLTVIPCSDTAYSSSGFRNIVTPLCYFDGFWYGLTKEIPYAVYKLDSDFNFVEITYVLNEGWSGATNVKGCLLFGNCLYFNTYYTITRFNLTTKKATALFTNDSPINTVYYYGHGYLGYITNNDCTNTKDTKFRLKIGDINCDDQINAEDLVAVESHILGKPCVFFSRTLSDINDDQIVNLKDLVRLKRYLLGHITNI